MDYWSKTPCTRRIVPENVYIIWKIKYTIHGEKEEYKIFQLFLFSLVIERNMSSGNDKPVMKLGYESNKNVVPIFNWIAYTLHQLIVLEDHYDFTWTNISNGKTVITECGSKLTNTTFYWGENTNSSITCLGGVESANAKVQFIYFPNHIDNWAFYHDCWAPRILAGGKYSIQYGKPSDTAVITTTQVGGASRKFTYSVVSATKPFLYLVVGNISANETFTIQQTGAHPYEGFTVYLYDTAGNVLLTQQTASNSYTSTATYTGSGWA